MSIPLFSAPSASALFESWLLAQSSREASPLSTEAATPYRYIWQSWCDWLNEHVSPPGPMSYLIATGDNVQAFLDMGPSASASRRKGASAPISRVTRTRYGWLLREVYQHACAMGHMDRNPVSSLHIGPRPSDTENGGQVLLHAVLQALMARLRGTQTSRTAIFQLRDKAILLTLLATGMRSDELRSLRVTDLKLHDPVPGQYRIQINGERPAQKRSVTTRDLAGVMLYNWLRERAALPPPIEPWVFLSKRRGQLTHTGLYRVVSPWLQQACIDAGVNVPNHIGPATIRNTLILEAMRLGPPTWTDEVICRYFGLQSPEVFMRSLGHHLQHSQPRETRTDSADTPHTPQKSSAAQSTPQRS